LGLSSCRASTARSICRPTISRAGTPSTRSSSFASSSTRAGRPAGLDACDGVGEHADYGLLTLLRQDDVGSLQVHTKQGWIEAPSVPESFVCNIGDMLNRMTGGLYRSTPHRVRLNTSGRDRLSFPLFFDPDFDARIEPIQQRRHR
jgi:isopenicillin N synthase-like dioxygenase